MKKAIVFVLVLIIGSSLFAQGIQSINGNDWVRYTRGEKITFVTGWFSSLSTLMQMTQYWRENFELSDPANNILTTIDQWSFYGTLSVGDIIRILDSNYANPENRHWTIWSVIIVDTNKAWWSE